MDKTITPKINQKNEATKAAKRDKRNLSLKYTAQEKINDATKGIYLYQYSSGVIKQNKKWGCPTIIAGNLYLSFKNKTMLVLTTAIARTKAPVKAPKRI